MKKIATLLLLMLLSLLLLSCGVPEGEQPGETGGGVSDPSGEQKDEVTGGETPEEGTPEEPVAEGYDEIGRKYTLLEDKSGYEIDKGRLKYIPEEIIIPESFMGLPVKRIADGGFCKESIEGAYADPSLHGFNNDITKRVVLPSGLIEIGKHAFACATEVEEIVIPEGVTMIERGAFWGCTSLKRVTLPSSLRTLGPYAFAFCAIENLELPSGLLEIGANAFSGYDMTLAEYSRQSFTEVKIPASVRVIEDGAFAGCLRLERITLEAVPEILGYNAFGDTAWWRSHPDGMLIYKEILLGYVGEMPPETELIIPSSVKYIARQALCGQESLRSVYFPDGVKIIGGDICQVISNCSSLTSVRLPADMTMLPEDFFRGCIGLEEIALHDGIKEIGSRAFEGCLSLKRVVLPSGLKELPDELFRYCESLTQVEIPNGVSFLGAMAFMGCSSLKEIDIPSGVTGVGISCFLSCSSLSEIALPDAVAFIGDGAFAYCSSLREINIPSGVTALGRGAFRYCSSLESIALPEGLTDIGSDAFLDCRALREIVFPEGIKHIGDSAFLGCTLITSVIIPKSVKQLGARAFADCSALESIYYEGTAEDLELIVYKWIDTESAEGSFSEATLYLYSELEPQESGDFWYYDGEGNPTVWTSEGQVE